MLHEILLSLSGHPSPLLTADHSSQTSILSAPEKALLSSIAHLSDLHCKLIARTNTISTTHSSSICQSVATAIRTTHLGKFQRKILEVEDGILRKDAGSVGAYDIVPLTGIVEQFSDWTRRMEWFLKIVDFMMGVNGGKCSGAMVIDKLCDAIQTGYMDIEEAALSLVRVAETAWLKQVSAWILYGRLPSFGKEDFFVQNAEVDIQDYQNKRELLPAFVSAATAASMLFIGRSLNYIRVKGKSSSMSPELSLLSSHLRQLSMLDFPISNANFSRTIASIRLSLSQTTLQKLLPSSRVVEILSLLRQFFLLGRGEFATALISEADEKIRSRWRRNENLTYDKQDGLATVVVKDGEVSAVLTRTWAAMGSLQSHQDDQDETEELEFARDVLRLVITKTTSGSPPRPTLIASTPFRNLLMSIPVVLTMHITSPLDLFLMPSDLQDYASINAYLLSIHRAHQRLTDLWKITSLRRDHPAPPGPPYGSSTAGRNKVHILRKRAKERAEAMRGVWATSSAAVFFLGETEAYLQGEVVMGLWKGFQKWLNGRWSTRPSSSESQIDDEDIWLQAGKEPTMHATAPNTHDPQTMADAHRRYLAALATSLLLTTTSFTDPLYHLLQQIDHLVALVHRLHSIWQSLDLEVDEGVVDAFSDFHKEEKDVREQLVVIANQVKSAIEELIRSLREIDQEKEGWNSGFEVLMLEEEGAYAPTKVGRVDRLLMKLDFGGWFEVNGSDDIGLNESDEDIK